MSKRQRLSRKKHGWKHALRRVGRVVLDYLPPPVANVLIPLACQAHTLPHERSGPSHRDTFPGSTAFPERKDSVKPAQDLRTTHVVATLQHYNGGKSTIPTRH